MVGPGGNGKSVLLKVATALVGVENAAHVPLQELVDQRFYRAELISKKLNVYADIEQVSPKQQAILKALVSGDPILAERKYRDPVSFSNRAVMIFSCNELPDLGGKTYSIQRRLILIPFRQTFSGEKAVKGLIDRLIVPTEKSGLINRALAVHNPARRHVAGNRPNDPQRLCPELEKCPRLGQRSSRRHVCQRQLRAT